MRSLLPTLLLLVLALLPGAAGACPLCLGATDEAVRTAFLATTAGLSLLPLLVIGGLVWWIARRARQINRTSSSR